MKSADVRKKYIEFFKIRGHVEIPSAPLVPENDSTTLFTSSGMQPLIPYLLGQPHPEGKRLVNSQKSFRSQDIDEVGDNRHTTFFEMLGNWSLGDYFKKEQLPWIWEFLTKELKLPQKKLFVSIFEGNEAVPRDEESYNIWLSLGVSKDHIFEYNVTKNWWSRSGTPDKMPVGEIGGPDSEVFFEFSQVKHDPKFGKQCHPNCDCGRFSEIGNSVFIQYKKTNHGLEELPQKNVDFGGGLERIVAAKENKQDIFETDLFSEIIKTVEEYSDKNYSENKNKPAIRVVADHLKAAAFLIVDGVVPSNKTQGYVLRRLLRRAAIKMHQLKGGLTPIPGFQAICKSVLKTYEDIGYFNFTRDSERINQIIDEEMSKFGASLDRGLREYQKYGEDQDPELFAFNLFQSYGFPFEIVQELFQQKGKSLDREKFDGIVEGHRELSRTASKGMFAGGLSDHSEETTKLHTAHHLLLASLQKIVDPNIKQRGSNITAERLRMDFNFARKLSDEELKKVEELVNQKVKEDLPVRRIEMDRTQAENIGAQMEFGYKYPDRVTVYFVGSKEKFFSAEFCGGPHVERTGVLGHFKIIKEESAGSGIRRIYAVMTAS